MTVSTNSHGGGVSADSTADMTAVINGGDEFVKRLNDMKAAQTLLEQAHTNLQLGKSAVDAHNEAQRVLGEAKAKRDADMLALAQELDTARTSINVWSDSVKTQTNAALDQANAKLAQAQAHHDAARNIRSDADDYANSVRGRANDILADANAQATKVKLDGQRKHDALMKAAEEAKTNADSALAHANAMKDKYTDLVGKIQGVIGGNS